MLILGKKKIRILILIFLSGLMLVAFLSGVLIVRTFGKTVIQVDIHQNKKLIYLSTFAEPPQFAIWLENTQTKELKTIFVTHRVAVGDWEGKANVPVALPYWFSLFRGNVSHTTKESELTKDLVMAISGATPRDDYFSVRIEVKPGSEWNCWIEMNLAGDFNDSFPAFDIQSLKEDEFSCGQPALIYKAKIIADEGLKFIPILVEQSIWENGIIRVEPVSIGVTTAKDVFDDIQISIIRPKPKLIDKNKIMSY
jgi:hypothetical protein